MVKRPMYFFLGAIIILVLCYNYIQDKNLDNKVTLAEGNVQATGIVEKVMEKDTSVTIYLKEVYVYSKKQKMSCAHILVYLKDLPASFINGTKVRVEGKLEYFKSASNLGQFDELEYYRIQNVTAKILNGTLIVEQESKSALNKSIYKAKTYLKSSFEKVFDEQDAGIVEAMLLGEKQLLNNETKQLYQSVGISHILAISGLHISLIGMFVFGLLRKSGLHIYISIFISIGFIWYYGKLTNFSVSTNRAVVMMGLMLSAQILGRAYDMQSAAALSAVIILLQQPKQIENCGFLLSFGAIIGIALIYPIFAEAFQLEDEIKAAEWKKRETRYYLLKCLQVVKKSIVFSLSINLITFPITLYYYYEIPFYSILLNLLIIPLVSIILICAVIAGLSAGISLYLGYTFAGAVHVILLFYERISQIVLQLPFSIITVGKPEIWKLVCYYLILVGSLLCIKFLSRKQFCFGIIIAVYILCLPHKTNGLEVTFLNVGQGDCIFMENKNGTTYLVDCGSSDESKVGTYRLKPFMKAKGDKVLNYAIVTHSDSDHISGIQELLEEQNTPGAISIKNLILPNIEEKMQDDAYIGLIETAKRKKVNVLFIEKEDRIIEGNLKITCLHPYKEFLSQSANGYSTVLSVEYGKFSLLLTGDLEKEGENCVVENKLQNYNVLKVAHHGSKYSTTEQFLNAVNPQYAILSYGHKNRYGHPHKELLSRLKAKNVELYQTEKHGAVTIITDGKNMNIKTFLQKN